MFRKGGMFSLLVLLPSCSSADFVSVPLSPKRVYGKIQRTQFSLAHSEFKRLGWISSKSKEGKIVGRARIHALSMLSTDGTGIVVYFTCPEDQGIQNRRMVRGKYAPDTAEYRESMFANGSKVPIGVTSAQLLYRDKATGAIKGKMYRENFTAKLAIGNLNENLLPVQVFVVLPDQNRSFVYGALKTPVNSDSVATNHN